MITKSPGRPLPTAGDGTRRSNTRRRASLWLMMITVLLLSAEGMIRIGTALLKIDLDTSYGYPAELFVEDAGLGFALKPGYAGHFPNPPYDKIAIRINELGYRDRPFPPRSGQSRIVVLGDSITFGAGIAAEERYTDAAERLCTGRCEVLNLGVNNYQTENYRAQLERHVDALDPDIVVVGFCMNDIRPMARIDDLDKVRRSGAINRLRGVLKSSQLLRVGSAIWRATTLDAKAYDERWIRLAIEAWQDEAGRERLSNTLEQIRDFTESRGIRLVVVLFPEKHQLEDFEAYGLPYSMAEKAMAELGIPTISLLPRMKSAIERGELAPTEIFLPKDNIHFTPRVHEWIAKILIDHLPLEIPRDTEQS